MSGLIETGLVVIDRNHKHLFLSSSVRESDSISQSLSWNELSKGNNFLVDIEELVDVKLLPFARFSCLEQIFRLQIFFMKKAWLIRRLLVEGCELVASLI